MRCIVVDQETTVRFQTLLTTSKLTKQHATASSNTSLVFLVNCSPVKSTNVKRAFYLLWTLAVVDQ